MAAVHVKVLLCHHRPPQLPELPVVSYICEEITLPGTLTRHHLVRRGRDKRPCGG